MQKKQRPPREQIVEAYNRLGNAREVARLLGVGVWIINNELDTAGIERQREPYRMSRNERRLMPLWQRCSEKHNDCRSCLVAQKCCDWWDEIAGERGDYLHKTFYQLMKEWARIRNDFEIPSSERLVNKVGFHSYTEFS